jgi:glycerol-3-phosphate O-acyltransferase
VGTYAAKVSGYPQRSDPHSDIDEKLFFHRRLRLAKQWSLQHRIASEESISVEMFSTALKMARHRGLLAKDPSGVGEKRKHLVREPTKLQHAVESPATMGNAPTPVEVQ